MMGNVFFYFHGTSEPQSSVKLEFQDGVLQNCLRRIMKTDVRIELDQGTGECEVILLPFRLFVELLVRRGLVPFTEGMRE